MNVVRLLTFVALAALLDGCSFGRTVINGHVRDIDTSWIEPGVTTRDEIITKIGYPPVVKTLGGVRPNSFRWVMVDTDERKLEAGYIVTPTFEKALEFFADDILVVFDKNGVVSLVSRTAYDGDKLRIKEWREVAR